MIWRVKDWEELYERGEKKIRKMEYVLVPNKHDGYGFRCLMAEPDRMALLGSWLLLLQVASKANPRGYLVRATGEPHTPESIAKMTGGRADVIRRALEVLSRDEILWIEEVDTQSLEAQRAGQKSGVIRMDRMLKAGKVYTPLGQVNVRPSTCQWCDKPPDRPRDTPSDGHVTGVVSRHLTTDVTESGSCVVIFLCRSCAGLFESGKINTRLILGRFGAEWMPHVTNPPDGDVTPHDKPCDTPPDTLTGARAPRPDLTRPDQRGQDLTTTVPDPPDHLSEKSGKLSSPTRKPSSFPSPQIPKAVQNALLTTERIDWMRGALQGYMHREGHEHLPQAPDDEIVLRCLNAVGDADLETIGETLKTLRRNGQAPGRDGGPKAYSWFPKVLENIFQSDAAQ